MANVGRDTPGPREARACEVPLPASALLLEGAIGALALRRRRH